MMQVLGPLGLLETKFRRFDGELALREGAEISGYASLFGATDQGGDVVQRGAYGGSLSKLAAQGRGVKMLWQHDPTQPIGVWDEVREDGRGLFVKGRLLLEVRAAREAHVLLQAGAIDGLSIGYRTLRAEKAAGQRLLHEIELWEVSLVTFPMLPEARVQTSVSDEADPPPATKSTRPAGRGGPGANPGRDLPRGPGTAGVRHAGVTHRGPREMQKPETKSRAVAGLGGNPAAEAKAALSGFLAEFSTFQSEIKSKLQEQENRLAMLDRKSIAMSRPRSLRRSPVPPTRRPRTRRPSRPICGRATTAACAA